MQYNGLVNRLYAGSLNRASLAVFPFKDCMLRSEFLTKCVCCLGQILRNQN